jgi:hypothetical protein
MKVFLCIVSALALANSAVVKREAEAEAEADPYYPFAPVVPLVYHAPECTTVEETITLKQCAPKIDNKCADIEIPIQTIELKEVCQDITTKICTPKVVEASGDEKAALTVKREAGPEADAEADPQFLLPYAGLPAVHGVVPALHHVVQPVLYTTVCEDKVDKHCHQEPNVVASTRTVKSCQPIATVECTDVEQKYPRTTCTHPAHAVETAVANAVETAVVEE